MSLLTEGREIWRGHRIAMLPILALIRLQQRGQ